MNARGEASGDSDVRPSQMAPSVRSVSKMTNPTVTDRTAEQLAPASSKASASTSFHKRYPPARARPDGIFGRDKRRIVQLRVSRMRSIYKAERPSGSSKSLP